MTSETTLIPDPLYVPYPENPRIIEVGGHRVYEYVSPTEMAKHIENLARHVRLADFENVFVNMNGGVFLFEQLARLQGYKGDPVKIEFHRPPEAYGAVVTIPIPPELKGKRGLVLDDIYDSGGVLNAIMKELAPASRAVALVTKNGIPNQIQIPNILIGLRIDNKWVGGCGMDMGIEGEENSFRNYPGLVVKI